MKHSGHGEWLVHLLTTIGFFLLSWLLLLSPESITTAWALGILAFLLGLKTIGNLIIDSHNKIHYHWKSSKSAKVKTPRKKK
jgi:hypothetical protein